jgi:hypothetical protein
MGCSCPSTLSKCRFATAYLGVDLGGLRSPSISSICVTASNKTPLDNLSQTVRFHFKRQSVIVPRRVILLPQKKKKKNIKQVNETNIPDSVSKVNVTVP